MALAFDAVPVSDIAEGCSVKAAGRALVGACCYVNSIFTLELFGKNRCEEVNINLFVAVVIVYGCVFEYGDEAANFALTVNDGVLFADRSPFANLYKVEISEVLVLGRLGGVLNLNGVSTSYELNLDAEHVRGHGVVVLTCCVCIINSSELEGGFEYVLVCSTFVNGVLSAAFLIVLHSHVNCHFVDTSFCYFYGVKEIVVTTFDAVPVSNTI